MLQEEAGLGGGVKLAQLSTFGDPGRDPRGRVMTVAYVGVVNADQVAGVKGGDDADEAGWVTCHPGE